MKPHKNIARLLRAFAKVNPEQKLVCVGPFKTLKLRDNEAFNLIKKMTDKVIIADQVKNDELRAIVKNSEGLLFPSLYEGFGLPPIEAMAAKVPVLVSETSCLPEICGERAIYCDPYSVDAIAGGIERLVNLSPEEREQRTQAGHEYVARYNWDDSAKRTLQVFQEVLAN
jgi:glycosyltransferase involved in cell wall biosynthesis